MAKKIKWHTSPSEDVPRLPKEISKVLVWLEPGVLAKLVVVEKRGKGWGTTKNMKVLGVVAVVKVHSRHPHGFCDVLRDGKVEQISNVHLRPVDD